MYKFIRGLSFVGFIAALVFAIIAYKKTDEILNMKKQEERERNLIQQKQMRNFYGGLLQGNQNGQTQPNLASNGINGITNGVQQDPIDDEDVINQSFMLLNQLMQQGVQGYQGGGNTMQQMQQIQNMTGALIQQLSNDPQMVQDMNQIFTFMQQFGNLTSQTLGGSGGGIITNTSPQPMGKIINIPQQYKKAEANRFEYPKIKGYYIASCLHKDRACGAPAAHAWCRTQRYEKAKKWEIETDMSQKGAVYIMGDKSICMDNCDGFSMIQCLEKK